MGGTILILSKTSLFDEAAATGFRPDTLEKGGTALNLFIFDVPRLSVDIDVNYIGAPDLDTMQKERPHVEELLTASASVLVIQ